MNWIYVIIGVLILIAITATIFIVNKNKKLIKVLDFFPSTNVIVVKTPFGKRTIELRQQNEIEESNNRYIMRGFVNWKENDENAYYVLYVKDGFTGKTTELFVNLDLKTYYIEEVRDLQNKKV